MGQLFIKRDDGRYDYLGDCGPLEIHHQPSLTVTTGMINQIIDSTLAEEWPDNELRLLR